MTSKKLWLEILLVFGLFFIGCGDKEPDIISLSDTRFNGYFSSSSGSSYKYTAYEFNGTNRVIYRSNNYYTILDSKSDVLQCKLSGDIIRFEFWYTGYDFLTYQYYFDDIGNLWLRNIDIDSQFFFEYEKRK